MSNLESMPPYDSDIDIILRVLLEYREHASLSDESLECSKIYNWICRNKYSHDSVFELLDEMCERNYLNLVYFLTIVMSEYNKPRISTTDVSGHIIKRKSEIENKFIHINDVIISRLAILLKIIMSRKL